MTSAHLRPPALDNLAIADRLDHVAYLLEEQGASQYRVQAWRNAAATLHRLKRPVSEILSEEGLAGLEQLPGIGPSLSRAIRELAETSRLVTLERLRGGSDPLANLASVAGIGHGLAKRIHDTLAIETLEELEMAAHDGRLANVPGFGQKRIAGVREALAARLSARRRAREQPSALPGVGELLDVDREYRDKAEVGSLPTIAPRRFNPAGERWLPILHTTRGRRHYTALFSNTALAHRADRIRDWVVLYFDGREDEHQCTVVTATRGPLAGKRVVRGREADCAKWYGMAEVATI